MTTFVAFLRGINIGGKNKVAMKELRELCVKLGFKNPRTVLASGNLVFESTEKSSTRLSEELQEGIRRTFGLSCAIVVLSVDDFRAILESDPIPAPGKKSDWLTVMFFSQMPSPALLRKVLDGHEGPEIVEFGEKAAYIYYTDGIGRSKLNLGKAVHQAGTVRNRNTLKKVAELTFCQEPQA